MKNLLAFSGSLSSASVNNKLVNHVAKDLLKSSEIEVSVIRLSDFISPLYSKDEQDSKGIPQATLALKEHFTRTDGFIISIPEYNSSVPAGFKNAMDWLSRTEGSIFQDKPILLMSASPGGRGGGSVLNHLSGILPFWGAKLAGVFSLPNFNQNFSEGAITDPELKSLLDAELGKLKTLLEQA